MTPEEQIALAKEYQTSTDDERRSDIILLFKKQYWPLIFTFSKNNDDLIGAALVAIHECLQEFNPKNKTHLVSRIVMKIKWAMYDQVAFNNRLWKRSISLDKPLMMENNGFMSEWLQQKPAYEMTFYDYPLPKVSKQVWDYFIENKSIAQIYKDLPLIPTMGKIKNMQDFKKMMKQYQIKDAILNEINELRIAAGNQPITDLLKIKSNFKPVKVNQLMWQRRNKDKIKEYYARAKAKGLTSKYYKNSEKKRKSK